MKAKILLYAIDTFEDSRKFERLATDLLIRQGLTNIIPIGGVHDHGRDAEVFPGKTEPNSDTFFGYSLEKTWKSKVKRDIKTLVDNYGHRINFYAFVTNQSITGIAQDKMRNEVRDEYGILLKIFEREWLRSRLYANPELVAEYLELPEGWVEELDLHDSEVNYEDQAWATFLNKDYEEATIYFKYLVSADPDQKEILSILIYCLYQQHRYVESLDYLMKLEKIESTTFLQMSKGSILAEIGRSTNSHAHLLEAESIFEEVIQVDPSELAHFNYANALDALGKYEDAISNYKKALELNPNNPSSWKNLGGIYNKLGETVAEFECYDEALRINPNHVNTIMSKGITLLSNFRKADEALALFEKSRGLDSHLLRHFPMAYHWYADAFMEKGDFESAFQWINDGLTMDPSREEFIFMKSRILVQYYDSFENGYELAKQHLKKCLKLFPGSHQALAQLIKIELNSDSKAEDIWVAIHEFFQFSPGFMQWEPNGWSKMINLLQVSEVLFGLQDYVSIFHGFAHDRGPMVVSESGFFPSDQILRFFEFSLIFSLSVAIPVIRNSEIVQLEKRIISMRDNLLEQIPLFVSNLAMLLIGQREIETQVQKIAAIKQIILPIQEIGFILYAQTAGFLAGQYFSKERLLGQGFLDVPNPEEYATELGERVLKVINQKFEQFEDVE